MIDCADGRQVPDTPKWLVTDDAHVMTKSASARLIVTLEQFRARTGHEWVVWIGKSVPKGWEVDEFCTAAFNAWGVGQKGKDDGLALFIFDGGKVGRIRVGFGLENAIPDAEAVRVGREIILPKLQAGDFEGGIGAGLAELMKLAEAAPK